MTRQSSLFDTGANTVKAISVIKAEPVAAIRLQAFSQHQAPVFRQGETGRAPLRFPCRAEHPEHGGAAA